MLYTLFYIIMKLRWIFFNDSTPFWRLLFPVPNWGEIESLKTLGSQGEKLRLKSKFWLESRDPLIWSRIWPFYIALYRLLDVNKRILSSSFADVNWLATDPKVLFSRGLNPVGGTASPSLPSSQRATGAKFNWFMFAWGCMYNFTLIFIFKKKALAG